MATVSSGREPGFTKNLRCFDLTEATLMEKTRALFGGIVFPIAVVGVLSIANSAHAGGVPTAITLLSYPNPSLPGMTVTLTAVVQTFYDPSLPPPTGNVGFSTEYSMNNPIGGILGPYQLLLGGSDVVSSTAQFRDVPYSLPWPYDLPFIIPSGTVTACYSGDAIYAPSCSSVAQSVVPPDTTLTLTSSSNPSPVGQRLQFRAVVTARVGIPSGVVKFADTTTGACWEW
jgi:hypothetical protein